MITASTTLRRSPQVVFRPLAEGSGGVILHLETAAYHGVNDIGGLVWDLLGDGRDFASLVEQLRSRLDGAPDELEADVAAFLEALGERNLIVVGQPAAPA